MNGISSIDKELLRKIFFYILLNVIYYNKIF